MWRLTTFLVFFLLGIIFSIVCIQVWEFDVVSPATISVFGSFTLVGIYVAVFAKKYVPYGMVAIDKWITEEIAALENESLSRDNVSYLTGKWKGYYVYGQGAPPEMKNQKGFFELELTEIKGVVIGKCIETSGYLINKPVCTALKGFREKNYLSFTKFYKNPNYATEYDTGLKNYDVEYEGVFNREQNKFTGNWTLKYDERKKSAISYDEFILAGSWEITKL